VRDDGLSTDHRAFANMDAGQHRGTEADPHVVLDHDRRVLDVVELCGMSRTADRREMGGAGTGRQRVACRVVDIDIVRDEDVVADRNSARGPDPRAFGHEGIVPDHDLPAMRQREELAEDQAAIPDDDPIRVGLAIPDTACRTQLGVRPDLAPPALAPIPNGLRETGRTRNNAS